jgi:DNA-binding SARP family transcriptional activator
VALLEFRVLGPLEVWRNGERVPIPAPKQRALLGLLLLRANSPVPQDELIDQLWGEQTPPTARASLQNQVHALRRILGPEVIERQPAGYVAHVGPEQLDLTRFERLVAESRRAQPKERAGKLREALACWRGPALVEFPTEPFAQHEINRLEEERLTALEERIDAELELGEAAELVPELEGLVQQHPLRERLWAQLMLALYRAGRQADALATYRQAHATFDSELGIEPGVVLRELQRAILVQDPALHDSEQRFGSTLERAAAILPVPARDRAESLYEYGVALLRTGDRQEAMATLRAAERLAAAAAQVGIEERARLYVSYLSIWTEGKSPREHLAEASRSVQRFDGRGDAEGLWIALRQQSQMLRELGRADASLEVAERCAAVAERMNDPWRRAQSRITLAMPYVDGTTPVPEGIGRCEAELAAADADYATPFGVLFALSLLYAEAARIDEARGLVERAQTEARAEGMILFLLKSMDCASRVEIAAGRRDAAIAALRSALAIVEPEADRAVGPVVAADLARLLALDGQLEEARRLALTSRASTTPDFLVNEILWRRALALVSAYAGPTDEAVRLSNEALARTAATDWLLVQGETLEEAATIRELAGDHVGARAFVQDALAAYERKASVTGRERLSQRLAAFS